MMENTVRTAADVARDLLLSETRHTAIRFVDEWLKIVASDQGCVDGGNATSATAEDRPHAIGPWVMRERPDGTWFERSNTSADSYLWGDATEIGPKANRRRTVLFGESVARGWGLDPFFNPAQALRSYLGAGSAEPWEVVDLARNGLLPDALCSLMAAARPLGGDVYVVFAGNNWLIPNPRAINFRIIADVVNATGSWRPAAIYIEELVRAQAYEIAWRLCATARAHGTTLVFVIPASNLTDWVPDRSWQNPILSGKERNRRDDLIAAAEQSLTAQEIARAEKALEEVLDLEEGLSPVALFLLGQCAQARRDPHAAHRLFAKARDAVLGLPIPVAPMCSGVTAQAIREAAREHGAAVVDLDTCFRDACGGEPFGGEFFLDSVHMNAEGIRLAMAAVAAEILRLSSGTDAPTSAFEDVPLLLKPEALAQGHFTGAFYAWRCGQPAAAVRRSYREALESSEKIVDVIRLFLDRTIRRAPDVVCESVERLRRMEAEFPGLRYFTSRMHEAWEHDPSRPNGFKQLDHALIREVCKEIAKYRPDAAKSLLELLDREHSIDIDAEGERDLLVIEPPMGGRGLGSWNGCFFASSTPAFSVPVITGSRSAAVTIRAVARVPPASSNQEATMLINGGVVHAWRPTERWSTTVCQIDAKHLVRGQNTLTILWPLVQDTRSDRARHIAARASSIDNVLARQPLFPNGLMPGAYPTFGELYSLAASVAK